MDCCGQTVRFLQGSNETPLSDSHIELLIALTPSRATLAYLASITGAGSRQPRSSRKCLPRALAATESQISSIALSRSARYAAGRCVEAE